MGFPESHGESPSLMVTVSEKSYLEMDEKNRGSIILSMGMQQDPIDWSYLPYILGLFFRPM